jgi:succinate-semialdehyde dehydrogenase / glutarate-semialdehyde dehydrogenase
MTPEDALADLPLALSIGGEWRDARGGGTFPVRDPANGEPLASVADATVEDALAALDAACAAAPAWAARPPRDRAEVLRSAFEQMTADAERIATLLTLEMGKPLAESRDEVGYAAEYLRWFSEEAVRVDGGYSQSPDGRTRTLIMRAPAGPALVVAPWNFPLVSATREIGPALAAGCPVVLKPARETPLSTLAMMAALARAGVPDGVVNVLPTTASADVTGALIDDDRLRVLAFTGSSEVGRDLIARSADKALRLSMELGGNAPFIVFDDADLDDALDGAVLAKIRNLGESCTAANRFLVAAPLAEEFASRLAERMERMRIGVGTDEGVQVGPLIDEDQLAGVEELVQDAIARGATALTGAERIEGPGHFYRPTVLAQVPKDARIQREEIFGPVAPVSVFDEEDEAVARANATEYGLAAYVYTRDLGRALRVAERLQVGMIGLNRGSVSNVAAPFGGMKRSGFGRKGGHEGIEEYLETKYVAIPAPETDR